MGTFGTTVTEAPTLIEVTSLAPLPATTTLRPTDGSGTVLLAGSLSSTGNDDDNLGATHTWVAIVLVACLLVGISAIVIFRKKHAERPYSPENMGPSALPAIFDEQELESDTPSRRPLNSSHYSEETPEKNALDKKSGVVRPLGLQWDPYMATHDPAPTVRVSSVSNDTASKEPVMGLDGDEDSMEPPDMSISPDRLFAPRQPPVLNLADSLTDSDTDV